VAISVITMIYAKCRDFAVIFCVFVILHKYLHRYLISLNTNCNIFCDFGTEIVRFKFTVADFTCMVTYPLSNQHVIVP